MKRPLVTVLAGRAARVKGGHPWVYSNEIQMDAHAKAHAPGTIVKLQIEGGESLGLAVFNPHTLIAARRLDADSAAKVDAPWFVARFQAALALREKFFATPYYRLVHAEADGLPGLIIDRYGDVLVVQANVAGMDALLPDISAALQEVCAPRVIVLHRSGPTLVHEGLTDKTELLFGALDGPVRVEENGAVFFADPVGGQKTGWFYDQRDNRAFAAALAKGGRVFDGYCYAGGFGVLAAKAGAREVVLVDRSAGALELVTAAAKANGVEGKCSAVKAEVMDELERRAAAAERFDVCIVDPPAFIKSKKDMAAGLKGYRKLARLAAVMVEKSGFLVICSCSHHAALDDFHAAVAGGVYDAGRTGRLVRTSFAGPDHPVHPLLPESAYLKCLVLQLD